MFGPLVVAVMMFGMVGHDATLGSPFMAIDSMAFARVHGGALSIGATCSAR